MGYLIGTDEAGYGPNLGPLVISATVWRVPDEALRRDLYETLDEWVGGEVARKDPSGKLAIADSKKLYQPGGGLEALECGVLASLRVLGKQVARWRELWTALDADCGPVVEAVPWHRDFDAVLPWAVDATVLNQAVETFSIGLRRAGVSLVALRSLAVFPERWNHLLDKHDTKATALSCCTLGLVRDLLAPLDGSPVLAVCDKHGGRNRYGPLLQHFFPDEFVETQGESRALSVYRWGAPTRRVEIRFLAKGEQFLPSALASMASKYLRELAMAAFNDFWRRHKPGLKPTAGYPLDARRFKNEIESLQRSLGISDYQLWRNR